MERFFGFDLGDAESAVTRIIKGEEEVPQVIPVQEAGSFITAYAMKKDGQLLQHLRGWLRSAVFPF